MTKLGFAGAILAIVAVATWAYNVNYETKTTLNRIDALHGRIAAEREHIQVLEVEWAWLNNPDRLARLAAIHAERLGLGPMSPDHFGRAEAVPFPPRELPKESPLIAGLDDAGGALVAGLMAAPRGTVLPPPRPASWSVE